jgi:hypothetical protein
MVAQPSNPRVKPATANTSGRNRGAMMQKGRRRIWNVLRSLAGGAFLLLMLVVIALFAVIWLEAGFLSTPGVPVRVSIVETTGGTSPDDVGRPTTFSYRVRLPDGSERRFVTRTSRRVGDQLLVTSFRGRLTGMERLRDPSRLAGDKEQLRDDRLELRFPVP